MPNFYDEKEIQPVQNRENDLFERLPAQLKYAREHCEYYRDALSHIDISTITNRALLTQIPVTRKSDLIELQGKSTPFGGLVAHNANLGRLFQSPGPINDPEGQDSDWWRMGRAFFAAGFSTGDVVQNCLSYHLTPGGFIMDSGARACECIVIPAGPGQTEQQLDIIKSLKPSGYCGTPSFLKILLDKALSQRIDISCIKKALVTGEPLPNSLREDLRDKGVNVLQAYASADVGLIAYESEPIDGMIVAEDIIVEILRPGTQIPVAEGEVGEIVVTNFNKDYPLIRFATGDMSAIQPNNHGCERTNIRIKSWLGRADQTVKVKGMFVHPQQIEKVRSSFTEIEKVRLVVDRHDHNDFMRLICELKTIDASDKVTKILTEKVISRIREVTKLGAEVTFVNVGAIKNDGVVIEDKRVFN